MIKCCFSYSKSKKLNDWMTKSFLLTGLTVSFQEDKRTIQTGNCQYDLWLLHCPVSECRRRLRMNIKSALANAAATAVVTTLTLYQDIWCAEYYNNCILLLLRKPGAGQAEQGRRKPSHDIVYAQGSEISPLANATLSLPISLSLSLSHAHVFVTFKCLLTRSTFSSLSLFLSPKI